jgi:MFS family permease
LFINSLYLQQARGLSALHAGLLTMPLPVMLAVSAPISGRITAHHGPRISLVTGGLAMTLGAVLLLRLQLHTPVLHLFAAYAAFGLGAGLVNAPISATAISAMPDSQAGLAAAIASSSRQVGASLGVAITGALITGHPHIQYPAASHPAWALIAALGLAIALLGIIATSRWADRTAQQTRQRLLTE